MMEGLSADSEEKHEPASDIDTALMDSLKVLDPEGPIREADIILSDHEVVRLNPWKKSGLAQWHRCVGALRGRINALAR
jgi:hypothetical protein